MRTKEACNQHADEPMHIDFMTQGHNTSPQQQRQSPPLRHVTVAQGVRPARSRRDKSKAAFLALYGNGLW
jgi:hypothetical protein